jgi:hypothetical protein
MSRLMCGIYTKNYSLLILLKRSTHCGSATLDPVLASVSPKAGGWTKTFFVVVLTRFSTLGTYSNCLTVLGEEPSPIFGSFSFGALEERLVVGFLGSIVPAT